MEEKADVTVIAMHWGKPNIPEAQDSLKEACQRHDKLGR